jgi:serine kinase of HPr protein (carbohydrate metabolism regulator)
MAEAQNVHACCVLLGEAGILIRGPAGAGKSSLARELVHAALLRGRFACLVSDDRTRLEARHGRVLARPVEAIAGRMEVRGIGILPFAHEPAAVLRLVVDLSLDEPPRLPEEEERSIRLCGILVPRLSQRRGAILADLVTGGWSGFHDTLMTA